jgi:RNA polymerase-binding protein DksA
MRVSRTPFPPPPPPPAPAATPPAPGGSAAEFEAAASIPVAADARTAATQRGEAAAKTPAPARPTRTDREASPTASSQVPADGPDRTAPATPVEALEIAAGTAAKGATMAKSAETKTAAGRSTAKAAPKHTRSAAETERIREALADRRNELHVEYDQTMAEISELQRDRLTDSAGDDQADTGTKTFEREQEISLANSILEKINQVERALERLDDGSYGWCERCGNPIPVERLAAFPSATLCVTCKQLEERR